MQSDIGAYGQELAELAGAGLRRCRPIIPLDGMRCRVDGLEAVNFSSNNYLGLAEDPRLKQASMDAVQAYGTSSSASRLISGTLPLFRQLEESVARFKQAEAALVFNSGYQANVAILQALLKPDDWVFADKLNHASLVDGCLLSGARLSRYQHRDMEHLRLKLKKAPPDARKWIVTDSVFSMDGDYPDLQELIGIAEAFGAYTLIDEAHATGLFGVQRSSGLCEHAGVSHRVTLQMGTFSKALGSFGAYVAGSETLIQLLINKARGFIYSTALPPAVAAASLKAVELVQSDASMKERLWKNVALLHEQLKAQGTESDPARSPIIPVVIGDSAETMRVCRQLLEKGYFVQGIRPPTVPAGTARLRVALSAAHNGEQIRGLAEALTTVLNPA